MAFMILSRMIKVGNAGDGFSFIMRILDLLAG